MKGDFARVTFDPTLHYSQVFQQQGRVLLEADWNEQAQIQSYLLRTLVCDLVGHCWAVGDGFAITPGTTDTNGEQHPLPLVEWKLSPGHFYVDGILCANESDCTLGEQPNAPTHDYGVADGKSGFENPPENGFALWLDVWERHLCAVEAPHTADIALDGVETASRAQVVWQIRLLGKQGAEEKLDEVTAALQTHLKAARDAEDADSIATINQYLQEVQELRDDLDGDGSRPNGDDGDTNQPCILVQNVLDARTRYAMPRMQAELGPQESDNDPCVIAADARYRGCENQLYRVEIHQAGTAALDEAGIAMHATAPTATFKWSRENGSVVFPVTGTTQGTTEDGSATLEVTLGRLGRDVRLGLAANDWVELADDDYTLARRAYPLLRVITIDTARLTVTLDVPAHITPWVPATNPDKHPLLRRWEGVSEVEEGDPITLEDGIQVTFGPGGLYATGDYWLIPARVADNGRIYWPENDDGPAALSPRGLHHHAVLGIHGGDEEDPYAECCCRFGPVCEQILSRRYRRVDEAGQVIRPLRPNADAGVRGATLSKSTKKTTKRATKKTTRRATRKKAKKVAKKTASKKTEKAGKPD